MDEREWLASEDPVAMLRAGDRQLSQFAFSDRKLRLFACACWRMIWTFFPDRVPQFWKDAANWAESFADGEADGSTLPLLRGTRAGEDVHDLSLALTTTDIGALTRNSGLPSFFSVTTKHRARQAALLRDIVGNPFRRPVIGRMAWNTDAAESHVIRDLGWLTPDVFAIATACYEERAKKVVTGDAGSSSVTGKLWEVSLEVDANGTLDNARLGVLSDALEEAGCDSAELLEHLRSPGPHIRGCWVLDLILGRA